MKNVKRTLKKDEFLQNIASPYKRWSGEANQFLIYIITSIKNYITIYRTAFKWKCFLCTIKNVQ